MKEASADGLRSSLFFERRCHVVCIHNASTNAELWRDTLLRQWDDVSVEQATEKLSRPGRVGGRLLHGRYQEIDFLFRTAELGQRP